MVIGILFVNQLNPWFTRDPFTEKYFWALNRNSVKIYGFLKLTMIRLSHKFSCVTCANLWPDWIIRITMNILMFQSGAHILFVIWVPKYSLNFTYFLRMALRGKRNQVNTFSSGCNTWVLDKIFSNLQMKVILYLYYEGYFALNFALSGHIDRKSPLSWKIARRFTWTTDGSCHITDKCSRHLWPLLLTWFIFNPSMDK